MNHNRKVPSQLTGDNDNVNKKKSKRWTHQKAIRFLTMIASTILFSFSFSTPLPGQVPSYPSSICKWNACFESEEQISRTIWSQQGHIINSLGYHDANVVSKTRVLTCRSHRSVSTKNKWRNSVSVSRTNRKKFHMRVPLSWKSTMSSKGQAINGRIVREGWVLCVYDWEKQTESRVERERMSRKVIIHENNHYRKVQNRISERARVDFNSREQRRSEAVRGLAANYLPGNSLYWPYDWSECELLEVRTCRGRRGDN